MALIPVINNHTGDEGAVDESWLERWPEDFTPLSPDHVPLHAQEQQAVESDSNESQDPPSDGTPTEEIS